MSDQIATATSIEFGEDFMQHRIAGDAAQAWERGLPSRFDVPLVSHVEGNLYQGGCYTGAQLPDGFKHVLSLYPWGAYALPDGCERLEVKMYDSEDQGFEQVEELAKLVVGWLDDGPTLVHCQAGLNRSGLLAARVLMLLGDPSGVAIEKVRKRSPLVLCNPSFEAYLVGLNA